MVNYSELWCHPPPSPELWCRHRRLRARARPRRAQAGRVRIAEVIEHEEAERRRQIADAAALTAACFARSQSPERGPSSRSSSARRRTLHDCRLLNPAAIGALPDQLKQMLAIEIGDAIQLGLPGSVAHTVRHVMRSGRCRDVVAGLPPSLGPSGEDEDRKHEEEPDDPSGPRNAGRHAVVPALHFVIVLPEAGSMIFHAKGPFSPPMRKNESPPRAGNEEQRFGPPMLPRRYRPDEGFGAIVGTRANGLRLAAAVRRSAWSAMAIVNHRLRDWARLVKRDLHALYLASRDPRMPWYTKALAAVVAGYALSPIDLIPDFVPVVGYLDDVLLVPLGILLVIRLIPPDVMAEHRIAAAAVLDRPVSRVSAAIICVWVVAAALCGWLVHRYFAA